MRPDHTGKQHLSLNVGLLLVTVVPILMAGMKTLQLILCYDKTSGLLAQSTTATAFSVLLWICAAGVAAAGIWMGVTINGLSVPFRTGRPMLLGIGLFVVGICFLGQSVADLLAFLEIAEKLLQPGSTGTGEAGFLAYLHDTWGIGPIQIAVSVIGFITAIAFIVMAYSVVATGRRPHLIVGLIPVIWCVVYMFNLMYTYENLVSMQTNGVKTGVAILTVLFLYYMARNLWDLDGKREAPLGVFARILFPGFAFAEAMPYCVVYLMGIRDRVGNMPYLALTGLALYGGVGLIQLYLGACSSLRKAARQSDRR